MALVQFSHVGTHGLVLWVYGGKITGKGLQYRDALHFQLLVNQFLTCVSADCTCRFRHITTLARYRLP